MSLEGIQPAGGLPALVLALTAAGVILLDLFVRRRTVSLFLSLLGTTVALALAGASLAAPVAAGADRLSGFLALLILAAVFLALLLCADAPRRPGRDPGKVPFLLLTAGAALLLLVSAASLPILFLSLQIFLLAACALTAYGRDARSVLEGALKLFTLGALSSAFLLLGIALVFGATGHLSITEAASALQESESGADLPLLLAGSCLVLAGLAFTAGAFPFHSWLPDTLEAASVPASIFLAAALPAAGVGVILRLSVQLAGAWDPAAAAAMVCPLAALAASSVLFGSLAALAQRNLVRILAYSAVAHAGYGLIGVAAAAQAELTPRAASFGAGSSASVLLYIASTVLATAGALAAISLLRPQGGEPWSIDTARGLARKEPLLALALVIFLASLIGLPPTAGFWGKLAVFQAALQSGHVVLVLTGIVGSLLAIACHWRIISVLQALPQNAAVDTHPPRAATIVVGLCALGVLGIGFFPETLWRLAAACALR